MRCGVALDHVALPPVDAGRDVAGDRDAMQRAHWLATELPHW
jgi:hypothetical protein